MVAVPIRALVASALSLSCSLLSTAEAFTAVPRVAKRPSVALRAERRGDDDLAATATRTLASLAAASAVAVSALVAVAPAPAHAADVDAAAYNDDAAGDKVEAVVRALRETGGNRGRTFATYEELAAVITEGKDVGGAVDPGGVKVDRGYVSDEDTSIYNPGLSLLTDGEKERLLEAVVESRRAGLAAAPDGWSEDNQFGFEFLRSSLDPLHMYQLKGYLGVFPLCAGAAYLGALFVQQNARSLFPAAYALGVLALFLPVGVLIALGP